MDKKLAIAILCAIVIYGGLLRLWDLGDQSLWIDEAYTINGALSVLEHGYPLLDSGNLYTNVPGSVYLTAIVMSIWEFDPFNPWNLRLIPALLGTLIIIATYLIGTSIWNDRRIGLLSAFLLAFSYSNIALSRQVRGYTAAILFISISIYFLWKYVNHNKPRDLAISVTAILIASIFHWTSLALLPALLAIVIAKYLSQKNPTELAKKIGWSIVVIFALELIVFYFLHWPGQWFRFYYSGLNDTGYFVIIATVFTSLIVGFRTPETRIRSLYFLATITLPVIPIILSSRSLHTRYFVMTFGILSAILIVFLIIKFIDKLLLKIDTRIRFAVSFLIIILIGIPFSNFKPINRYTLGDDSPQPNYADVYSIIASQIGTNDLIISPKPVLDKVYLNRDNGLYFSILSLQESKREIREYFYVKSSTIENVEELLGLIESNNGFIWFDSVFLKNYYYPKIEQRIGHLIEEAYARHENTVNSIVLYKF